MSGYLLDDVTGLARIVVAAPPKSGSTHTSNVLGAYFATDELPGLNFQFEHVISNHFCEVAAGRSFCLNYHMVPHELNLLRMELNRIAYLVLWRNLGDMVLSANDHADREDPRGPMLYVIDPRSIQALSAEQRHQWYIDTVTPWYLSFYLRWREYGARMYPYETMAEDASAYFTDMLSSRAKDGAVDGERLRAALRAAGESAGRLNVGIVGRSARVFSDAAKRRLEQCILQHPNAAQLEILLWELPWDVPALERRSPYDGEIVQVEEDPGTHFFFSRGVGYPIARPSWRASRTGSRRTPRIASIRELEGLPLGEPLL